MYNNIKHKSLTYRQFAKAMRSYDKEIKKEKKVLIEKFNHILDKVLCEIRGEMFDRMIPYERVESEINTFIDEVCRQYLIERKDEVK